MANNTYTNRINQNKTSASDEYGATLETLKADIKSLNATVDKAINDEIDRLIPQAEKKRFMERDSKNEVELNRKISSLKPSRFFEITGESADNPSYATYAKNAMKPSEIEKPEKIEEEDWKKYTPAQKKNAYYNDIKTKNLSKLEELVFKGMPEDKKRKKIANNPDIYFDMLSKDKKLELIARYGEMEDEIEGGRSAFEDKLEKAQKRKQQLKASIKSKANKLIASMQKVIEKNAKEIEKLQKEIEKQENELNDLKTKPIDITEFAAFYKQKNPKGPVPSIDDLRTMAEDEKGKAIKAKKSIITNLKTDLKNALTAHNTATKDLESAMKDLENILAEKDIYVGSQSISENSQTPTNNNSTVQNVNTGSMQPSDPKMSQSKKAGNMLKDMIGTSKDTGSIDVEDFKDMLHSTSYEQMVAMAKQLRGPIKKGDLTKFYDIAWDNLKRQNDNRGISDDIDGLLPDGITLDNIKDIVSMDESHLSELEYKLQDYLKDYSNTSKKDQETIDALMDYVKIGMLRRQTEHVKWLSDLTTPKKVRLHIGNFTRLLEKHSEKMYNRENAVYSKVNTLRAKINLPPIDISTKVATPKIPSKNKPTEHTL